MHTEALDQQYADLQQRSQQTAALFQVLAAKLTAAATAGDQNAREWQLDLREIALAVRDEENATSTLLQGIHTQSDAQTTVAATPADTLPPVVNSDSAGEFPTPYQPDPAPHSGAWQRFLGSSFGQAIATGAGFSVGDDLVNSIFRRL